MNVNALTRAGINYKKGVERFLGDERLYQLMLTSFLDDDTIDKLIAAFNNLEYKDMFECVHNIKGVAGNLDMTELYLKSAQLVDYLRLIKEPDIDEVTSLFTNVITSYQKVKEGILAASEDK